MTPVVPTCLDMQWALVIMLVAWVIFAGIACDAPERSSVIQLRSDSLATAGVITLGDYQEGDSLVFYNEDGSVWLAFDPYFREDEAAFTMPEGFKPRAFHPDYFLLVLSVEAKKEIKSRTRCKKAFR